MKKSISTLTVISKAITANRKRLEAAAVDFQAYFIAYNSKEPKKLLEAYKAIQKDAKDAGDKVTLESATKFRLMIEDALGRAKRIRLTAEERAAIQALVSRGFTFSDISEAYIIENLTGTEWVSATGEVLKKSTKKQVEAGKPEYVPVVNWTPTTFASYLKKAFAEATSEAKASIR